jgi:hypothetical protein
VTRAEAKERAAAKPSPQESEATAEPCIKTLGLDVPAEVLVRAEKEQGLIDKMSRMLSELKRTYTEYEQCTGVAGKLGPGRHFSTPLRTALDALNLLRGQRPASVCPHCKLIPDLLKTCAACRRSGILGEEALARVEPVLLAEGDDAGVWVDGKWRSLAELLGDDF